MSIFEGTVSIAQHITNLGLVGFQIIKNPKTGKRFGKDSQGNTYRVADKVKTINDKDLSISVFTPEDGDASYMIHTTGDTSANVLSSYNFGAPATAKAQPAKF